MKHDTHDQQPITGFALYADGSLLLKRGHGCRLPLARGGGMTCPVHRDLCRMEAQP
jgi:hypothetical protein